jgi:two-component system response regulator HydG
MIEYDWPGNVRELENCIECAAIFASSPAVHAKDLPLHVRDPKRSASVFNPDTDSVIPLPELERQAIQRAMAAAKGNKLLAAKLLGIGKTTLYRKLKEVS